MNNWQRTFLLSFILMGQLTISDRSLASDVIPISTCEQLQAMQTRPWANYELVNDIDCSQTRQWNLGQGFLPVGGAWPNPNFTGTLNGNNFKIKNLYSNLTINLNLFIDVQNTPNDPIKQVQTVFWVNMPKGLFGVVSGNATIKNLILENIVINQGSQVGQGFAGYALGLERSDIYDNSGVGALVGIFKSGLIENVHVRDGSVLSILETTRVGGLVGRSDSVDAKIKKCSVFLQRIMGTKVVGGLVGDHAGIIEQSYANGYIILRNPLAVGISGFWGFGGGLVGHLGGKARSLDEFFSELIKDSYSLVKVKSFVNGSVAGLIGSHGNGAISSVYSAGKIYSTGEVVDNLTQNSMLGGVIGRRQAINNGAISSSYWNKSINENIVPNKYTSVTQGVTSEELRDFAKLNFDFSNTWSICNQKSYPFFKWQNIACYNGDQDLVANNVLSDSLRVTDNFIYYTSQANDQLTAKEYNLISKEITDINQGAGINRQILSANESHIVWLESNKLVLMEKLSKKITTFPSDKPQGFAKLSSKYLVWLENNDFVANPNYSTIYLYNLNSKELIKLADKASTTALDVTDDMVVWLANPNNSEYGLSMYVFDMAKKKTSSVHYGLKANLLAAYDKKALFVKDGEVFLYNHNGGRFASIDQESSDVLSLSLSDQAAFWAKRPMNGNGDIELIAMDLFNLMPVRVTKINAQDVQVATNKDVVAWTVKQSDGSTSLFYTKAGAKPRVKLLINKTGDEIALNKARIESKVYGGINCGSQCVGMFEPGQKVILSVAYNRSSVEFHGWPNQACVPTARLCEFVVDQDEVINLRFTNKF